MSWVHTILLPTDFSERAEAAFLLACAVARDQGARLLVLYVDPPPVAHGETVARRQADYPASLWEQLHRLRAPEGVSVDYHLAEGRPVDEILRLAEQEKCDLIIMPTHGHTGLARLLMGSVSEEVVRRARCPVLTLSKPSQKS